MVSKSSRRWLNEHFNDTYVEQSKRLGYRSRASFKLLELQERDKLINPDDKVLDLGAAPGGWSQVVAEFIGGRGSIIASDILPMDSIADVEFIQGDFTEQSCFDSIMNAVGNQKFNLVISDMAPNMSGVKVIDQPKSIYLAELALDMAQRILAQNGSFVSKLFHGEGFDAYIKAVKQSFNAAFTRKPAASRSRSREVYLVAKGFRS